MKPYARFLSFQDEAVPKLSAEQLATLKTQMQQHIQQVTQMTLLTSNETSLVEVNLECKKMASDLLSKTYAYAEVDRPRSMFHQPNLMPSLHTVDEWEKTGLPSYEMFKRCTKGVERTW